MGFLFPAFVPTIDMTCKPTTSILDFFLFSVGYKQYVQILVWMSSEYSSQKRLSRKSPAIGG